MNLRAQPYAVITKASVNSIEYQVNAYIDDMARKVAVVNELYDLSYRQLAAAGIDLRPLGVAASPRQDVDSRQRLLSSVELFRALPREEIEALSRRLSRHEYESDQVAVPADAVTDYLLIVESGVIAARPAAETEDGTSAGRCQGGSSATVSGQSCPHCHLKVSH